ncbi:ribosome quality control complex subunit TCF25 [Culicoides brevitarsis]|uniref:ribosome quality control complex subunit TCF25 n=1 Tax=Culicoides brevitarsis TaxID=469753 RepID=UPI00307C8F16
MSSRVLKKLSVKIQEPNQIDVDENESDCDLVIPTKKQLNINRYDLLNQTASPSESEIKEDDDTERGDSYNFYNAEAKKKKKKRKTKKRTGKYLSQRKSSEDNADAEDDISRTVREVDKLFGTDTAEANAANLASKETSGVRSLLSVQHKNLNAANEMKRMFGTRVIQAEQNKRRNPRGAPRLLRSTWLVNPKENWPPVGKTGIYMNLVPNPDTTPTHNSKISDKNAIYFSFEHSPAYRQLQQKFLTAVETMDSDNIIKIINQQPYHVDSLIQLSELCKMSEDYGMASELIEHAVYALESSFHSMFSIVSGTSRLDYRRQENRALFIVLFKHAQFLESRACSRTALEITKFLLTLDPENDNLAVKLILDFYAIRAKQFEWLTQLFEEWEETHNLSQLPNMAYSYALALFYTRKLDEADKALQYALMMFPAVLRLLLDELAIQTDSRVTTHPYFAPQCYSKQRLPLQQLTSLYVARSKMVWRDADILPWLERNVGVVLDKVDSGDPIVAEYEQKRSTRYITPPRPILRHIVLSDFKEKVPLAEALKNEPSTSILMYDPLPPLDSIDIYTRPDLNRTSAAMLNGSPLSMFFQSLLPSFSVQGNNPAAPVQPVPGGIQGQQQRAAEAARENEGAVGGGVQSYAELRTSLNSIVDAMRDFLSNIRVPERPNDADVDENEESSDDEPNDYLT